MEDLAIILGIIVLLYVILLVVSLVMYILQSIGLHTMGKREGIPNSWLAWIPFGNYYIVGELLPENKFVKSGKQFVLAALIFIGVSFFLSIIVEVLMNLTPFLGVLALIVHLILIVIFTVYIWIGYYYLLTKYTKNALPLTLLSVFLCPFIFSVALFILRNKPVIGEPIQRGE